MMEFAERHGVKVTLGLGLLVILLSFFTSTGIWNIDEFIYFLGADGFAATGSLIVENGFDRYQDNHLRLWFLVPGPNGLVSQYPAGTAILGGLVISAFGVQGVFLLNALVSALGLWIVFRLALQLYQSPAVAMISVLITAFSTFYLEFAYGIGSHALSITAVLASFSLAWQSVLKDQQWAAVLSGSVIGFGMLVRVDTVLILPAIAAFIILFAARPALTIASGAVGLVPGLALSSLANQFKFGTWNPVSYGSRDGGAVDLSGHIVPVAIVLVGLLALIAARNIHWSRSWRKPSMIFSVLAFGLVVFAGHVISPTLGKLVDGLFVLLIDSRTIIDTRPGMEPLENGVRIFFGYEKKALAQSMPWLGGLLFLVGGRWTNRRAHLSILIAILIWSLPFALRQWHGGLGLNMRYFLPVIPLLAILASAVIWDISETRKATFRQVYIAVIAGGFITMIWAKFATEQWASAGQQLGLWIFFALAIVTFAAGFATGLRQIALMLILVAVGAGFSISVIRDISVSQAYRLNNERLSRELAELPRPNVFVGPVEAYTFQSRRPDGLIALPPLNGAPLDGNLLETFLKDGFHVFLDSQEARVFIAAYPNLAIKPRQTPLPAKHMVELALAPPQ